MAERNLSLQEYRDGFEAIVNRAMEYVNNSSDISPVNHVESRDNGLGNQDIFTGDNLESEPQPVADIFQADQFQTELSCSDQPLSVRSALMDQQAQMKLSGYEYRGSGPRNVSGLGIQGDFAELSEPVGGIFSEDFWSGDALNLPMMDDLLNYQMGVTS
jgi:hypothetical protein